MKFLCWAEITNKSKIENNIDVKKTFDIDLWIVNPFLEIFIDFNDVDF